MTPIKLRLKGFKGIKSGLKKDEITIEFPVIKGKIAFVGPNGIGKSTILQNMHPYLLMPDRVKTYSPDAFSFYDECFLEESEKELLWKVGDRMFLSLIKIYPDKKKTLAFLYKIENGTPELVTETSAGTLQAYNEVIEKLLGSSLLFFTSVFRSQTIRSLYEYSKGELKDVFSELIGLDKLEMLHERSSTAEKITKQYDSFIQAEISRLEHSMENVEQLRQQLVTAEQQKLQYTALLDQKKTELNEISENLIKIKLIIDQIQAQKALVAKKEKEIQELVIQKTQMVNKYESENKRIDAALQNTLNTLNTLTQGKNPQDVIADLESKINTVQTDQLNTLVTKRTQLDEEHKKIIISEMKVKTQLEQLSSQIQKAKQFVQTVPCDNSLKNICPLLKDVREQLSKEQLIDKYSQALQSYTVQKTKIEQELSFVEKTINELQKQLQLHQKLTGILMQLKKHTGDIEKLNSEKQNITKYLAESISQIESRINSLTGEVNSMKEQLVKDDTSEQDYQTLIKKRNQITEEIKVLEIELQKVNTFIGNLTSRIQVTEKIGVQLQGVKKASEFLADEINDWSLIKKLISKTIPLEIENAGPKISYYANEILKTTHEGRFSVEINAKSGSAGSISGIEIVVYDEGVEKPLRYLSGGEKIWIEEAIVRAMTLYQQNSMGVTYETLFSDEKDGALDEENKIRYMRLKNKVLELGGFEREFFISHSKTAQDEADYVINFQTLTL